MFVDAHPFFSCRCHDVAWVWGMVSGWFGSVPVSHVACMRHVHVPLICLPRLTETWPSTSSVCVSHCSRPESIGHAVATCAQTYGCCCRLQSSHARRTCLVHYLHSLLHNYTARMGMSSAHSGLNPHKHLSACMQGHGKSRQTQPHTVKKLSLRQTPQTRRWRHQSLPLRRRM